MSEVESDSFPYFRSGTLLLESFYTSKDPTVDNQGQANLKKKEQGMSENVGSIG